MPNHSRLCNALVCISLSHFFFVKFVIPLRVKLNEKTVGIHTRPCSGHGSLLLETCFCQVGYKGVDCSNQTSLSNWTQHCGPYDDRCYYHSDYGVAQVSHARWKSAQAFEDATWAEQRTSDRNEEHAFNFDQYSTLALLAEIEHNKSIIGRMIEIGSGPFTQSMTLFEKTGLRPASLTLLEPLAETYKKNVKACRYKHGQLTNEDGSIEIENTFVLPQPAEKFNSDGSKTKYYDTLMLVNMIEHTKDAFLIYSKVFEALRPGGIVVFHERYWPDYNGLEKVNHREFDLHPIRLNERFAHWLSTEFDLMFEKEQKERWGNLGYYWIGRKREFHDSMTMKLDDLAMNMEFHANSLRQRSYNEKNIWGNIYNGRDLEQPREYLSYSSQPWVKTICELGFAGGHSTVVYRTANPSAQVYSFDDFGKLELSQTAHELIKEQWGGFINLTKGDSRKTITKFATEHPEVYCDVISIDGAHHADFPDLDMQAFKHLASYPNIVLIDDYHEKDWPAVVKGVRNRVEEGSMKLRHVSASSIIFRNKQKQWAIAEFTMMTLIIASLNESRLPALKNIIDVAKNHPVMHQVIILWNTDEPIPTNIQNLSSPPGRSAARVTVIQAKSSSLNNRFDPNLPIHTGAVMILDDDLIITSETLTCAFNKWKLDPHRVYGFGGVRRATTDAYVEPRDISEANFILPRMIFHRIFLSVYFDAVFDDLRKYVDEQAGHCDDLAFAFIITNHTRKPFVYIDAYVADHPDYYFRDCLSCTKNRVVSREECTRHIIGKFGGMEMPTIDVMKC